MSEIHQKAAKLLSQSRMQTRFQCTMQWMQVSFVTGHDGLQLCTQMCLAACEGVHKMESPRIASARRRGHCDVEHYVLDTRYDVD